MNENDFVLFMKALSSNFNRFSCGSVFPEFTFCNSVFEYVL